MYSQIYHASLLAVCAPLIAAMIAGIFGRRIGKTASHSITIFGVALAFAASCFIFKSIIFDHNGPYNFLVYPWIVSGSISFDVSFLVDPLSAIMLVTVTFVSLLVHIYSIGYMHDDPGYQRFFSYMSLFTFAMIILVLANNFALLFFGWESVGLVSYLLIGFWFNRESAAEGSLKAFIVNRVGDFGFLLGLAAIVDLVGSLNYQTVFANLPYLMTQSYTLWSGMSVNAVTLICLLLFIGAMGKSAQVPLHVWLPESMEGPTPISALIHAATMVTAGVYMLARLSPMFELSTTALSVVLIIGSVGALFMGLIGLVQNDIKRVIAYSTMSQLGYMVAAAGASAYPAAIFHLVTHAGFKALLFLAAGSVIIALHHEQDMRRMGGLRQYLPVTYVTFLMGALALAAVPPFSGFYSKDAIIEVVRLSQTPGATFAYYCLLMGAFVTALYIFRAFFMTFHGEERFDAENRVHLKESPLVVTLPLMILAVPTLLAGVFLIYPMLYSPDAWLSKVTFIAANHETLKELAADYHGMAGSIISALGSLPFWFSISGILLAWFCYVPYKNLPQFFSRKFLFIYKILIHKYGFDAFNHWFFVKGTRHLSHFLYKTTDEKLLDDQLVNGSGRGIEFLARLTRRLQTGYLYHYAFGMMIGLFVFLLWVFWK